MVQELFGSGKQIADHIRERIKFELGLTASVGGSYNKIFAKLGSVLKKPDAPLIIFFRKHMNSLNKTVNPVRSLGVRTIKLVNREYQQLSFLEDAVQRQKQEDLEHAVDQIHNRFGHFSIQRGVMLLDPVLSKLDPVA